MSKTETKKVVKTISLKPETIKFLEKEFPNITYLGAAVDETVRKYKEFKGKPTASHL